MITLIKSAAGIFKFNIAFLGFTISLLTLLKMILILTMIILFIYMSYIEYGFVFKEINENNYLSGGFIKPSTKRTLLLIGSGLAGLANMYGNWLSIRDEHDLKNTVNKEKEMIAAEWEKIRLEKAQLKIDLDNETTKFIANSLNIENKFNVIENHMKERDSIMFKILELSEKIRNGGLSDKEKKEFINIIETLKSKISYKEQELTQLKNKLDKDIKEFKTNIENTPEAPPIGDDTSSSSTPDVSAGDGNTPRAIRSPLDNLEKNLIDFITDIRDNWYSNLNKLQQLCFSLLVLNGVIFACVVNICLSLFGEYLINRFSLETRYPKLSKLIQLRKTFQNYYLKINLLLIIIIVLSEMLFSIAVISL